LKEAGAGFVMVTGAGARDGERLAMASRFGADLVVDVIEQDPAQALHAATGRLADLVVDVTARAPSALGDAVRIARPGGTIVLAGTRGSTDTPGFDPDRVVYKELRILGALGVDAPAYRAALDLLATGRYPFDQLSREVVGLTELPSLLARMAGEAEPTAPVHGVLVPGSW
jgi:alcohol dehydrogenase